MAYTFFFLLGIPFWLIPLAQILGGDTNRSRLKFVWAGAAFFAPVVIFGVTHLAQALIKQQLGETVPWARGFGYFLILANLLAFFSPFVVVLVFKSVYGGGRNSAALVSAGSLPAGRS